MDRSIRGLALTLYLLAGCASAPRGEEVESERDGFATSAPVSTVPTPAVSQVEPPIASVTPTEVPSEVPSAESVASAPDRATDAPVEDVEVATPRDLQPEFARGQCTGRADLKTAKGDVSCYPYRCRNGRCLLSCSSRQDCAGSDGPADLAENGWPLDCQGTACVPLPPGHVHP